MKKRIYYLFLVILCFSLTLGCLSVQGGSSVFEAINCLGYTDEEFNHEIAKAIFNRKIKINFNREENEFSGYIDMQNPDIFVIEGFVEEDIESAIELATIFSYLGYIRKYYKEEAEVVHIKALEHAKKTYEQGKQNYVIEAAKREYQDPRGFSIILKKIKPKKGINGVFRWPR